MNTPNWEHNSGKAKKTKGRSKSLIRARRQAKQALIQKLYAMRETK